MTRRWLVCVLSLPVLALGCMHPAAPPPFPHAGASIAVLPPNNRTGDDLLIAGASILEKYALASERWMVPDALAAETREALRGRGVTVVAPETVAARAGEDAPKSLEAAEALAKDSGLEGAVLYLEIRRWEGDGGSHPAFVIAGVDAALIDAATAHVTWAWHRPAQPVATAGSISLGDAYQSAVRAIVKEMLAAWTSDAAGADRARR